jgi:hypothetical protein
VRAIPAKGAALKATKQSIDTRRQPENAFGFAEYETNLRRQLEGIAKAKSETVYKGRSDSTDVAKVLLDLD